MKKLITFALCCLILSSCNDDNVVKVSKDEYNKLKGVPQQKVFKVGDTVYEIFVASDSCEYYPICIATGGYTNHIQYFHYPQCSYCKKNNYETNK